MARKVSFQVTFDLPDGATVSDARDYVRNALLSECGGLHPDDPMFYLHRRSVSVNKGGITTKEKP